MISVDSPGPRGEDFYTFEGYQNFYDLTYLQTSRLYFDIGGSASNYGAYSNTLDGLGYYFDDMSYKVFNSSNPDVVLASFDSNSFEASAPEPSTVAAVLFAGVGLAGQRRRRRKA